MNFVSHHEALARFGSTVRGDSDEHSDSDLLFLSDTVVRRDSNRFAALGFSVSSFTWQQFEAMADEGSLFIQHLKQEGRIVQDPSGRLHRTLERFEPATEHAAKAAGNSRLIALTGGVSDGRAAIGWACDVLSVAFRNHAVLDAAAAGIYLFSYPALVDLVVSKHDLSEADAKLLLSLRILKREYRQSGAVKHTSLAYVHDVQALLEQVTGVPSSALPLSRNDFIAKLLSTRPETSDWYYSLRSYEGAYRALSDGIRVARCERDDLLEYVLRSPSPYSIADFGCLAHVRDHVSAIAQKQQSWRGGA